MKPRIAWVTYDLPFPPNAGGKLRALNLIKCLKDDFEVDLFSFYRKDDQLENFKELKGFVGNLNAYKRRFIWDFRNLSGALLSPLPLLNVSYLNRKLREDLTQSASEGKYHLFHFEFLGVTAYLPLIKKLRAKVVMGNENVEYKIYESYTRRSKIYPLVPLFKYDSWKMKRFEEFVWKIADANLAVSAADAEVIESVTKAKCYLVPNGVEISSIEVRPNLGFDTLRRAFFSGNLNYQQNRDAILWFLKEVVPLIKKDVPDFKVLILSDSRPSFLKSYGDLTEVVGGENQSFEEIARRASVFVSPVRIKGGSNIKVLQAAAAGMPLVGTQESFTGYDFENEKEVLLAADEVDFARKTVRLIRDVNLAAFLARRAWEKVKKYRWENSARILKDVYHQLLS